MSSLEIAVATYIAYLMGSFSSAIIVCRMMGLPDPRREGSFNPGASNVLRIGGKKAAILTLLGDMLKGFLPVIIARLLGFNDFALSLIAFAAFLGHLYPIFFRFEGGKGVATGLGAILALSLSVGLIALLTWIMLAVLFRYASVASIVTFLMAPLYMFHGTMNTDFINATACMTIFIIWRHRSNIQNLLKGKERKFGDKPT